MASKLRQLSKDFLSRSLWRLLGRRNLVRLGRFLSNEGRLDTRNVPETNGELELQASLLARCAPGASLCVFDVGANIGEWSKAFLEAARARRVEVSLHAFEPFAGTHQTLTQNLRAWGLDGAVTANNLALSSSSGTQTFYSFGDNIGINSLYDIQVGVSQELSQQATTVQTATLDEYCAQHGIEHIDLLKIDTEGHDFEVIQGCRQMLEREAIDILQFEYNFRWIYARHFLKDVFDFVAPYDLLLGKLTARGVEYYDAWHFELESFREGNYLLMRPALRKDFAEIPWWKRESP